MDTEAPLYPGLAWLLSPGKGWMPGHYSAMTMRGEKLSSFATKGME